jgi:hypothetical protein
MSAERSERVFQSSITRREVNKGLALASLALFSGAAFAKTLLAQGDSEGLPADGLMHARAWSAESADKSTHVLGNGRAMVHELGPNILYFRAPWISAPNLLTMDLMSEVRTVSSRERGTLIWQHTVYSGARKIGTILDFLDGEMPVLRRVIRCDAELMFVVKSPRLVAYADRYPGHGALLGRWPYGSTIYGDFKSSDPFTLEILYTKGVRVEVRQAGDARGEAMHEAMYETGLRVPAGMSELILVGGEDIEHCLDTADRAIATSAESALMATRELWKTKLRGVRVPHSEDAELPVADVVDDVATLLLGHRSYAGSVAAGEYYPLFYVRDQYGVSRALLAMGMTEEARGILAFYYGIWKQRGRIHNAQSDGPHLWFHRAENDDVEMTGYLIVQAFDYLRASGDEAFVVEIAPMLEWALSVQEAQLFAEMLPFNGDETYVAGGVFPRTHLTDGSSEATLLYVVAAERLLAWVEKRKLWSAEKVGVHRERAAKVKAGYAANFITDGKIAVNHPRVPDPKVLPRFRYGVCLGRYDANCLFLSDTEIAEDGRYFCMSCYPKRTRAEYDARSQFIPSVGLTSVLLGYAIAPDGVMRTTTADAVAVFSQDGKFAWPKRVLPGYETAVVAMALTKRKDARAKEFLRQMLTLRDATGAWVEYYEHGEPQGCRCRPWESALSVVALLEG